MDTDDGDLFSSSEDDNIVTEAPLVHNPIEEHLIKQLSEIEDRIDRANRDQQDFEELTSKILDKLQRKAHFFHQEDSSGSESEYYDGAGVPILKQRKKRKCLLSPALTVAETWQRIIDNKWVIGVDLQNNSNRVLEEPLLYVTIKDQDDLMGVTCFWEMKETALWNKIEQINPDCGKIAATVVLDVPNFENSDIIEGHGVVTYIIEDCNLQTSIDSFKLTAAEAIDKSMTPRHSVNLEKSILAIKAASVERIVKIPLGENLDVKLLEFFNNNGFNEIFPDVHVSKNTETLRHCIIELLLGNNDVQLHLIAKSTSQLNILLHMLKEEIPEIIEIQRQNKLIEAAKSLEREIEQRLDAPSPREILNSSILTDCLIPG